MRASVAGISLFAIALTTAAHANDWSGAYAGVHVGGGEGNQQIDNPFTTGFQFGNRTNEKGALAGIQGGYNWQFGHYVLGTEADLSLSDITGTASCLGQPHRSECKPYVNGLGTLTAKFGYSLGDTLIYGKAGAAWMNDVDRFLTYNVFAAHPHGSDSRVGLTLGAGMEHWLSDNWSLSFEYQYATFGHDSVHIGPVIGSVGIAHKLSTATVGLNYWFGDRDQASDESSAATLFDDAREPSDWSLLLTLRYFNGQGTLKRDIDAQDGSNENSRLIYGGLNPRQFEGNARFELSEGWFGRLAYGRGDMDGRSMFDEDTPYAGYDHNKYSNSVSLNRSGSTSFINADLGHEIVSRSDVRLGAYLGYQHFHEQVNSYGCVQLAGNLANCVPSFAPDFKSLVETDNWNSIRIGLNGTFALTDRLSFTGDVAYLPYSAFHGTDNHENRQILFHQPGHGDGIQLEGSLDFAINNGLTLGIGARYWEWRTTSGASICEGPCITFVRQNFLPPNGERSDTHFFGEFVQLSYLFGNTRDNPQMAAASPPDAEAWTAPYIGVAAGARFGGSDWSTPCVGLNCHNGFLNGNAIPFTSTKPYLGIYGGKLWQVSDTWLVGAELNGGWADNRKKHYDVWAANIASPLIPKPNDPAILEESWDASLRARAGLLLSQDTLAYAVGGLALQQAHASITCFVHPGQWCLSPTEISEAASKTAWGWIAGLGLETKLNDKLSARLEYTYSDEGDFKHDFIHDRPIDAFSMSTALRESRLTVGLSYQLP